MVGLADHEYMVPVGPPYGSAFPEPPGIMNLDFVRDCRLGIQRAGELGGA